ncbi:MAG TPA: HAMP domain-containing sensor histidine kinase [Candidatus Dormibacteraeota bacterium]|nr:HAMP domain-containing sensor histidine kinase [Candidatus Dormibacteraeota bacterium]
MLVRFGLLALVPVIALGAVLAHELNVDVQQRYLETARSSATLITQVGIQPLLNAQEISDGLTTNEIAEVDAKLQGASVSEQVRRLKVWNPKGVIVYSDNHALIGRQLPIDGDLAAAMGGKSSASVTNGQDAENAGDNLKGTLIQAYVPLVLFGNASPSGAFELYLPYGPVQAAVDTESKQLYGVLALGLALFYASMFPVVLLADRWRRGLMGQAERTTAANLATLERLNALKSEFLIRISHQFRTALVGIQGFSEVMRDAENLELVDVKSFAGDIYNDAARLDHAFEEMLELDRMEAGRTTLKVAPADVNRLIISAVDAARRSSPEHTLTARLGHTPSVVPCDAGKVSQVLTILIDNAIKYSPRGSGVVVTTRSDNGQLEVIVKDQGPGMPGTFDSRLFAGIQGAQPVAADKSAGTGLGLPIARQIVEMHGGRIWFAPSADGGSEFHFTLPYRQATPRMEPTTTGGQTATQLPTPSPDGGG